MIKTTIYHKKNGITQTYNIFQIHVVIPGKKALRISTGKKIEDEYTKFWKDGRIIEKQRGTELYKLNGFFDRLKKRIEDAFERGEDIREAIDRMCEKQIKEKPITASGFYGLLDNLCKSGFKTLRDGSPLKHNSILNYQNLRSKLLLYDKEKDLGFENWDVNQWTDFRMWLAGRGLKESTIRQTCITLKAALAEGLDKDMHSSRAFLKKGFTAPGKDSENIYLSAGDLTKLCATKMSGDMKTVRDYFILASIAGGLRISDWPKIRDKKNYRENGKFLELVPDKTSKYGTTVRIYLTPLFKMILTGYHGHLPALPKYATVLSLLKKACRLAELKQAEEVTAHTARRSFINNSLLAGMPKEQIKLITGHRSDSFDSYVKLGTIESGAMQETFYKKQTLRAV